MRQRTKKYLFILTIFIILFLVWAALDDITTGNEPTLIGEYLIVAFSPFILVLLIFLFGETSRGRV